MKKLIFINKINLLFILISLFSTFIILGTDFINISNTRWIHNIGSDVSQSHIGWFFFKNDVWRFPLGINPNYGDEIGSSIIYSDSIPILALFFKLIGSILPENFQYFSIWFFICFFLQLYFSYKIILHFTKSKLFSFTSSLFFIIAPIFIHRLGMHVALSGQWILILTLYLGLTKTYEKSKLAWIAVIAISSLIHFYFTLIISIVFILFRISDLFINKEKFSKITKSFLITFIPLVLIMYLSGYFEIRATDTLGLGFGVLKLNILSIFDPGISSKYLTWSWILPDIKLTKEEEVEGFNYLGLGQILMVLLSLILLIKNNLKKNLIYFENDKKIKTFTFISIILTFLALSNKISIGTFTIIEIPLNEIIYASLSLFRASGRLFWIVNYFLIFISLLIIFKSFDAKKSLLLIIILFTIQILDSSIGLKSYIKLNAFTKNTYSLSLKDPIWKKIAEKNKIVKTTYPETYSAKFPIFSYFYEHNSIQKTNLIITARGNRKVTSKARYDLYQKFRSKTLDKNTIYIIDNIGHLINLKHIFKNDDVGFFYRDKVWIMLKSYKNFMNKFDQKNFDEIKPEILKTNEKKKMYFNNHKYQGFGWSHNFNNEGIWSEGERSTLLFSLEPNSLDKILEISYSPYITEKNKNLDVDIYVNEKFNQNLKLDLIKNSNDRIVKIVLHNELIKVNNEIKIDFIIKNPTSPLEILKSPDSRKLGLLLKSIELKDI